jgi:peptidoglycan-associated lipoprotein
MHSRLLYLPIAISLIAITSACTHKVVTVKDPPPPPAPVREQPAPAAPSRPAAVVARAEAPKPAPPAQRVMTAKSIEDYLNQLLDAYFDYNQSDLRTDAVSTLNRNSENLRAMMSAFPDIKFVLDGNADERGSAEYNLVLGDRRAHAAQEFLVQVGVPADRLTTISYGKERPICTEHTEECWQKNRRAHVSLAR